MNRRTGESSAHLQKLLLQAADGDPAARDCLIERASERLLELTRAMLRTDFSRLKRWEETDDVFQHAAMRLYRSLAEVQPQSVRQFFGLAATQVRRTLIDLVRHHFGPEGHARQHDSRYAGIKSEGIKHHETQPETLEQWEHFHEVVGSLPPDELEAFSLVWYSGMSQKEAADVLEISERTMIRRMNRARLLIQESLGDPVE
ncbi:MAG: sigma-70 family RNA polymerase sigma factor [Planctomycetaceae bacterium]|nr:sigma-70 family RNA polymerase sigma factor [Planctomycetaceae bacterium]